MARRKQVETDELEVLKPPEGLAVCFVEDWVDPWTHEPQPYELDRCGLPDLFYWMIVAHHAHGRARQVWLDEHDIPRDMACQFIPYGKPLFRDGPAFARAVATRFPNPPPRP